MLMFLLLPVNVKSMSAVLPGSRARSRQTPFPELQNESSCSNGFLMSMSRSSCIGWVAPQPCFQPRVWHNNHFFVVPVHQERTAASKFVYQPQVIVIKSQLIMTNHDCTPCRGGKEVSCFVQTLTNPHLT